MKIKYVEVDDCFLAAYQHFKKTNSKMNHYDKCDYGKQIEIGLASEDGYVFFMSMEDFQNSRKRQLVRKLQPLNLSLEEIINRNLMTFL
jgi:hypothetical protein